MIYSWRLNFVIRIKVCTQSVCSHPTLAFQTYGINKLYIIYMARQNTAWFFNSRPVILNCNFRSRPILYFWASLSFESDKIGASFSTKLPIERKSTFLSSNAPVRMAVLLDASALAFTLVTHAALCACFPRISGASARHHAKYQPAALAHAAIGLHDGGGMARTWTAVCPPDCIEPILFAMRVCFRVFFITYLCKQRARRHRACIV